MRRRGLPCRCNLTEAGDSGRQFGHQQDARGCSRPDTQRLRPGRVGIGLGGLAPAAAQVAEVAPAAESAGVVSEPEPSGSMPGWRMPPSFVDQARPLGLKRMQRLLRMILVRTRASRRLGWSPVDIRAPPSQELLVPLERRGKVLWDLRT